MLQLEERRLAMLPASQRNFGLIIPILVRSSPDELPDDLRNRYHEDFTELSLLSNMRKSGRFAKCVYRLANYIQDRWRAFSAVADDPCAGCRDFALPSDDEARDWLAKQPPRPIPWIHDGGRR